MKQRRARKIGAFRLSGHNPRPTPLDPWDMPQGHTVQLGTPTTTRRAEARANAAVGVHLSDPPRVPVGTPTTEVWLEAMRVKVPTTWAVSMTSARGRSQLIIREPDRGPVHVLVIDADGNLRELKGIPEDILADLIAKHFRA